MRTLAAVVAAAAALSFSSAIGAQLQDTLQIGDRVRVRVADTRNYTSVFIGKVAALSHDTLTLEIPGNKGTMVLPRLAIAEVALSNGRQSRMSMLPGLAVPIALPITMAVNTATLHSHSNALRVDGYVIAASLLVLPIHRLFFSTPRERWDPVYHWLDGK